MRARQKNARNQRSFVSGSARRGRGVTAVVINCGIRNGLVDISTRSNKDRGVLVRATAAPSLPILCMTRPYIAATHRLRWSVTVATLLAVERCLPPYRYAEEEVSRYVAEWLAGDASAPSSAGPFPPPTWSRRPSLRRRGSGHLYRALRAGRDRASRKREMPGFGSEFALVEFC